MENTTIDSHPVTARALYAYKSEAPDDLQFEKGDIINVLYRDKIWWAGTLNGNDVCGLFPAKFVEVISPSSEPVPHDKSGNKFLRRKPVNYDLLKINDNKIAPHPNEQQNSQQISKPKNCDFNVSDNNPNPAPQMSELPSNTTSTTPESKEHKFSQFLAPPPFVLHRPPDAIKPPPLSITPQPRKSSPPQLRRHSSLDSPLSIYNSEPLYPTGETTCVREDSGYSSSYELNTPFWEEFIRETESYPAHPEPRQIRTRQSEYFNLNTGEKSSNPSSTSTTENNSALSRYRSLPDINPGVQKLRVPQPHRPNSHVPSDAHAYELGQQITQKFDNESANPEYYRQSPEHPSENDPYARRTTIIPSKIPSHFNDSSGHRKHSLPSPPHHLPFVDSQSFPQDIKPRPKSVPDVTYAPFNTFPKSRRGLPGLNFHPNINPDAVGTLAGTSTYIPPKDIPVVKPKPSFKRTLKRLFNPAREASKEAARIKNEKLALEEKLRSLRRADSPGPGRRKNSISNQQDPFNDLSASKVIRKGNPPIIDLEDVNMPNIDKYVRNIKLVGSQITPQILATKFITRPWGKDLFKARALFIWISENIAFNRKNTNEDPWDESAEMTLRRRSCRTSEGFANLFAVMARACGISQSWVVTGYHKSPTDVFLDQVPSPNHFWNVVKINGHFLFVDCALASPSHPASTSPTAELYYFLASPANFIMTHYPSQFSDQFLTPPIFGNTFLSIPYVHPFYFKSGIKVHNYGQCRLSIDDEQVATTELELPEGINCWAEVLVCNRSIENSLYKKRALAQVTYVNNARICKIKAVLPGENEVGVLNVYAGASDILMSEYQLTVSFGLRHRGSNPQPFDFVFTKTMDFHIVTPQSYWLYSPHTYTFCVTCHDGAHHNLWLRSPTYKAYEFTYHPEDGSYDCEIPMTERGLWCIAWVQDAKTATWKATGNVTVVATYECL